jgi:hypothetical protein
VPEELFDSEGNTPETTLLIRAGAVSAMPADYLSRSGDELYKYAKLNGSITLQSLPVSPFNPEFTSAEQWLIAQGYGPMQLVSLLDIESRLSAADRRSHRSIPAKPGAPQQLATGAASVRPHPDRGQPNPGTMSIEEVRHQRGIRLTISEAIALVAIMVAAFSALNGWIVLPEQMRALRESDSRQDARMDMIERVAQDRGETLARIDERTKRIEERLKHPPQDF